MTTELTYINGDKIKAGTLFCLAKNYAEHAAEMDGAVPENPVFFIKPPQAIIHDKDNILLPDFSSNVHYEVELVVVIGQECRNIKREEAYKYIAGYAVGIDVTLRDLQTSARSKGDPWATAKGFYTSAPISAVYPSMEFGNEIPVFELKLSVNGVVKQHDPSSKMVVGVDRLIEYASKVFTLLPGDCIFTGTPKGIGPIAKNDIIRAELCGYVALEVGVK